jgi:hypothetical protein
VSNSKFPYTITDDAITMILGGKPVVLGRNFPGYAACARALIEGRFDDASRCSTLRGVIPTWHQEFHLSDDGKMIHYRDRPLPEKLMGRILAMCRTGEDPAPLFAFWRRLADNPSQDSVSQLYDFLENKGIPISTDGMILAYKAVRRDFLDFYTGKIDNSVGQLPHMPRSEVCADPTKHCAPGLHVGSLQYATTYGSADRKILICSVNPANVVSVPSDHNCQKMRVCAYYVIGLHSGQEMPSTIMDLKEDLGSDEGTSDEILPDGPLPESASLEKSETSSEEAIQWKSSFFSREYSEHPRTESPLPLSIPRRYQKYASMDASDLLQLPLEFLRELAGRAFKIVGASKVRGGKTELVRLIEEVRGR